jgi:hypothetical protein
MGKNLEQIHHEDRFYTKAPSSPVELFGGIKWKLTRISVLSVRKCRPPRLLLLFRPTILGPLAVMQPVHSRVAGTTPPPFLRCHPHVIHRNSRRHL